METGISCIMYFHGYRSYQKKRLKNKYGKYAGSTIKHENDVKRIFEKYHKDIIHDHNKMVLNNSMQEVTEHICESLKYS